MSWFRDVRTAAHRYDQMVHVSEIARRYFAMNAFDGVVTMIGVLAGCFAADVEDPRVVLVTGLTTLVAIGVSGFFGAYLTEMAERARDLEALEHQTLTNLKNTRIGQASRWAVWIVTFLDGFSPFIAGVIILLPFFFVNRVSSIRMIYLIALGLALFVLFGLGVFLGRVSRRNVFMYGALTVLAGGVSILVSLLLGAA